MSIAVTDHHHDVHDVDFTKLLEASFTRAVAGQTAVFTTDASDLNDLYLDSLPTQLRQQHNCSCCRHFIRKFGGLVTINEHGNLVPLMWATGTEDGYEVPHVYVPTFFKLWARVEKAKVTGVFLSSDKTWGTPHAGGFTHFAVTPPAALVFRERGYTARQTMAKRKEDFKNVLAGLADFKPAVLDEALRIFKADGVSRADKFIGPIQWLRDLHDRPKGVRGTNLLWRAIGTAPEGFCHPRSAVTGTLLEDIAAGMTFDVVKKRFEAKVGPLAYQRPQAPPSAGNIKAAEALFEKLGLGPSLERRFARFDEIPEKRWEPKPAAGETQSGGVFGHLTPKNAEAVNKMLLPARTMTWEKFTRDVLSTAEEIRMGVPHHGPFYAITTAVNADAPPILKWDQDDARNPFAWYTRPGLGGQRASDWNLRTGEFVPVTAIVDYPCNFGGAKDYFPWQGVILLLEGAKDMSGGSSNALFPECLKGELHQVRSTIEAYSRGAKLSGHEEASACGLGVHPRVAEAFLRVRVGKDWSDYRIDRWD